MNHDPYRNKQPRLLDQVRNAIRTNLDFSRINLVAAARHETCSRSSPLQMSHNAADATK